MNFLTKYVQLDTRKGIYGIFLAIAAFFACLMCYAWHMGLLYAAVFLAIGYIRIQVKQEIVRCVLHCVWVFLACMTAWRAPGAMIAATGQGIGAFYMPILNFLCIGFLLGFIFILTAKPKLSVGIGIFLLMLLVTISGFVHQFRGKELGFADILSYKTALSVAGKYSFLIMPELIYQWLNWVFVMFLGFALPELPSFSKKKMRIAVLLAEVILIPVFCLSITNIPIKNWDKEGTLVNGYYLNFALGIRDSIVKKPENYDADTVGEWAQSYPIEEIEKKAKRPNIIVIMNESFADLSLMGELQTNQPVTPFLDALSENTIRGYALTSAYGGNTANVEFEFLTGSSMAFLPANSVPYQQYIKGETYTFARLLRAYGYHSMSTHPYLATGWSRNIVYPYFGFEESTFIDDYTVSYPIRYYMSDRDMFTYVLDVMERKNREEPLFLFGITMQNHGGYDDEEYVSDIRIEGCEEEYPKAEQYLGLLHETDAAMEYLLTALASYPEDTLVLFFGDHLPNLEEEFYPALYGDTFDDPAKQSLLYTVPFMIWANYEMPEQNLPYTGISFLPIHLLQAAGLPLSPYHSFLAEVEEVIPAMNAYGYYSKTQKEFTTFDKAEGEEAEWLNRYAAVQYNHLFDVKNRNDIFFKIP